MPVRALVDAAAAASVRPYPKRQLMYVDASLHRVSVYADRPGRRSAGARRARAESRARSLADAFARRIADHFVRATRFDPFTHAETEQLLYDRLPRWLEALQREERVELHSEVPRRRVSRRGASATPCSASRTGFYRALIAAHRSASRARARRRRAAVGSRLAALPGFVGELARLDDAQIGALHAGPCCAQRAARAQRSSRRRRRREAVKRLPWREAPVDDGPAQAAERADAAPPALARTKPPTHVVYGGLAYRVGAEGLAIGREADPQRRTLSCARASSGVSRLHCEVVLARRRAQACAT